MIEKMFAILNILYVGKSISTALVSQKIPRGAFIQQFPTLSRSMPIFIFNIAISRNTSAAQFRAILGALTKLHPYFLAVNHELSRSDIDHR